jgi:ribosomal protein S9
VEYRRSLVNETGGGALNEQNIDSVAGANMTLTFNASGASLQLQLATAIVSSENFDFTIRVSGGGMLGRATINY